jgi:hypothetical protein
MNWVRARLTARAFYTLTRYDLASRLVGFRSIGWQLGQPAERRQPRGSQMIELLCDAVNLAACFYFKPVRCLQRSTVIVHLLREYGIDGRLVIGYRPSPFLAHAWAEVDGRVVNDSQAYQQRLRILDTM